MNPDLRNGALLGSLNGVAPSTTTIGNNTFFGTRYVYNVTKTSSPGLNDALQFMGVRPAGSGGNGYLCSEDADAAFDITNNGFVRLSLASAGSGLPNSRCRKNPTPI